LVDFQADYNTDVPSGKMAVLAASGANPFKVREAPSQRSDSNRRPAVYETAALPLSYAGIS
jgi:hypothetical protein